MNGYYGKFIVSLFKRTVIIDIREFNKAVTSSKILNIELAEMLACNNGMTGFLVKSYPMRIVSRDGGGVIMGIIVLPNPSVTFLGRIYSSSG